jgi:hypothetical protein
MEHEAPELRIKVATNTPCILDAFQIRFEGEIPNNSFFPRAFGLDIEISFEIRLMPYFG